MKRTIMVEHYVSRKDAVEVLAEYARVICDKKIKTETMIALDNQIVSAIRLYSGGVPDDSELTEWSLKNRNECRATADAAISKFFPYWIDDIE